MNGDSSPSGDGFASTVGSRCAATRYPVGGNIGVSHLRKNHDQSSNPHLVSRLFCQSCIRFSARLCPVRKDHLLYFKSSRRDNPSLQEYILERVVQRLTSAVGVHYWRSRKGQCSLMYLHRKPLRLWQCLPSTCLLGLRSQVADGLIHLIPKLRNYSQRSTVHSSPQSQGHSATQPLSQKGTIVR